MASCPRVFEGGHLRLGGVSLGRFEIDVVDALRIERRVEIDQVNGFVRDVFVQDVEIVAVVEGVHE